MPTLDEDLATASEALKTGGGKSDQDEVKSFVVMYRALEATRLAADPKSDAPRFGGTFEVPLPAELEAQMRAAFKAALNAAPALPPET